MTNSFKLPKSDRLYSRKEINELFENGHAIFAYPIKAVYIISELNNNNVSKAAFSVSKRNFKKAVDRNYYKRLLRESYRLNRNNLTSKLAENNKKLSIMFIYSVAKHNDYNLIENGMLKILQLIEKNIECELIN